MKYANLLLPLMFLFSCADDGSTETSSNNDFDVEEIIEDEIVEDEIIEEPIEEVEEIVVEDIDGNGYGSIMLGEAEWMSANLNTKKFRNGDEIPQIQDTDEWKEAGNKGKPAWCYYEDDSEKGAKYGVIYNYYALTDKRRLAPEGWHISTSEDWEAVNNIGSGMGRKMKSTSGWEGTGNGTNETGFNGLAGGYRYDFGSYNQEGKTGYFWCIGERNEVMGPPYWNLTHNLSDLIGFACPEGSGLYVRCVKD